MRQGRVLRKDRISTEFVRASAGEAYGRLIFPSLERETRSSLTDIAAEQAIKCSR